MTWSFQSNLSLFGILKVNKILSDLQSLPKPFSLRKCLLQDFFSFFFPLLYFESSVRWVLQVKEGIQGLRLRFFKGELT